jgi:hypothetical protein
MDWGAAHGWLSVSTGASGRTMVIGGSGMDRCRSGRSTARRGEGVQQLCFSLVNEDFLVYWIERRYSVPSCWTFV